MLELNKIHCGACETVMNDIDSDSVDCIITSPPYWGLRDYGVDEQIGLEPTLEAYHTHLLEVTAECKRVLKKTGTMFWVHGDSYGGSGQGTQTGYGDYKRKKVNGTMKKAVSLSATPKCITMQNYRLAMRMIDNQGWILRNILIWHKKNHMPSSVQDRYANVYEPVFFFSKSKKYWFDLDAIRKEHKKSSLQRNRYQWNSQQRTHSPNEKRGEDNRKAGKLFQSTGKNPGDVFSLSNQPFPEAHFATFPEKLIEPFIKAGCPQNGTVLDPFMGAGTTAVVAKKLGRKYLGIELNQEYIKIARKRISAIPTNLSMF